MILHHRLVRAIGVITLLLIPAAAEAQNPVYDRVILGGRVMDPATGLDAIRNVGISRERIAVITTVAIRGRDTLWARGLVVAPGFIDMHAHGQNAESYDYYAMDGVTTALELETGVAPVTEFYRAREGKARVNFGGSAAHYYGRRQAVGEPLADFTARMFSTDTVWSHAPTNAALLDSVSAVLRRELDAGALGIGIPIAYMPGASRLEIYRDFELCAEQRVICFTHIRGGLEGLQEVIANTIMTGASLQVVHLNSSSLAVIGSPTWRLYLDAIHAARARGLDVTTEAYPYTAASTAIQSAVFSGMVNRPNANFSNLIWVATGERLTYDKFVEYRKIGGPIIQLGGPDSLLYPLFRDSIVMVASDGIAYVNHRGHPRLAGTFARVLGRYVRDERLFSLMEALRRMTIMPARRLEVSIPQMRRKGRLAAGMDADIVVFNAARVADRATYEDPAQASVGFVHVLVNGTPVVRDEKLVEGSHPGVAIRRASNRR